MNTKAGSWISLTVFSLIFVGCAQMGGSSSTRTEGSADSPAKSAAIHPGMNANGEVIDATKVESGHGQKVKGINDYEGEITGIAAPNSRFTQLKIGMGFKQVMDIAGPPTDQGAYITVYKGEGRLIFAGGSFGDLSGGNLIWIIHCATEPGYR
jgi:hypothetical protein